MSDITQEIYEFLVEKTDEVGKLRQTHEAIGEKIRSGRYSDAVVRQELRPQRDELKAEIKEKSEKAIRDARAKVNEFRQKVQAENTLNPADLTDDIKLLRAGITLTADDLRAMLDRNSENKTMTQVILRFAKEHDINVGVYYTGGDEEKKTADQLEGVLDYYAGWIGTPQASKILDRFFGVEETV